LSGGAKQSEVVDHRGAKQIEDPGLDRSNKTRGRSSKVRVRGIDKANKVGEAAAFDEETMLLAAFDEEHSLHDCEQGWSERKGSFKASWTYLLVYHNSNHRTLQGFSDSHLHSTGPSSILQSPNVEFITMSQKRCLAVSKEQVKRVAEEFPVWLLRREQREEFSSQHQLRLPRQARAINTASRQSLGALTETRNCSI